MAKKSKATTETKSAPVVDKNVAATTEESPSPMMLEKREDVATAVKLQDIANISANCSYKQIADTMGIQLTTKGSRLSADSRVMLAQNALTLVQLMPESPLKNCMLLNAMHSTAYEQIREAFQIADEVGQASTIISANTLGLIREFYDYYGVKIPDNAISNGSPGQLKLDFKKIKDATDKEVVDKFAEEANTSKKIIPEELLDPKNWKDDTDAKTVLNWVFSGEGTPVEKIATVIDFVQNYRIHQAKDEDKKRIKETPKGDFLTDACGIIGGTISLIANGFAAGICNVLRSNRSVVVPHCRLKASFPNYNENDIRSLLYALVLLKSKALQKELNEFAPYNYMINPGDRDLYLQIAQFPNYKDGPHKRTIEQLLFTYSEIGKIGDEKFSLKAVNKMIELDNMYTDSTKDRLALYEEKGYPVAPDPKSPVTDTTSVKTEEEKPKSDAVTSATTSELPPKEEKTEEKPAEETK